MILKKIGITLKLYLSSLTACINNLFLYNVVYNKRKGTDDPWILATNTNYRQSIKDYNYRFVGIETLFKNQKSNGFYIEDVVNANEKAFRTMYALVCIAELFLTILGAEFSKNSKCYKNVKIETHKNYKNKVIFFMFI